MKWLCSVNFPPKLGPVLWYMSADMSNGHFLSYWIYRDLSLIFCLVSFWQESDSQTLSEIKENQKKAWNCFFASKLSKSISRLVVFVQLLSKVSLHFTFGPVTQWITRLKRVVSDWVSNESLFLVFTTAFHRKRVAFICLPTLAIWPSSRSFH